MEHVAWEARLLVEEELDDAIVLFYETVHAVARCDYTGEQLDAWAPRDARAQRELRGKLREERVVGVWERGMLVGFGSLDGNSDIDMLYTHACAQGRGIATCILQELEALAAADGKETMCVDASLTSAPFFERRGYRTVRVQRVERRGVMLDNVHMAKRLTVGTMAYSYRSQWVAGQERYAVNIQIFGTKKSFDTKKGAALL